MIVNLSRFVMKVHEAGGCIEMVLVLSMVT